MNKMSTFLRITALWSKTIDPPPRIERLVTDATDIITLRKDA
jgi:hypothetical protein